MKRNISLLSNVSLLLMLLLLSGCANMTHRGTATVRESAVAVPGTQETATAPDTATASASGPVAGVTNDQQTNGMNEMQYTTPSGETGYIYISDSVMSNPNTKVPMVLMMCGTGGDPRRTAQASGWVDKALEEGLIVIAPTYNNAATYSETDSLAAVVKYVIETYPVDARAVYSTGFSNGGAASVALTRDHPELFAAISAMGWMVDMPDRNGVYAAYDMPFQVIQGSEEFTSATASGAMAVMDDEQRAIRALLLFNEMIDDSLRPDYHTTAYWGYEPDDTQSITVDDREWHISNYQKAGYSAPFAQFVRIAGASHRPNHYEATIAWSFFKNYARGNDGSVRDLLAEK